MKKLLLAVAVFLFLFSCKNENSITGLKDEFADASGWYEILPKGDTVAPTVKIEAANGILTIWHQHRSLEEAYKWCPWIKWERDFSTNLRKNYGVVDLDKYHYVVINVKQKGSSSYFDINGFTTKLGFTTGITAIDLKDYNDQAIKGTRKVDFGIDLQDNHTSLVLKELKFVSELTAGEKERLIGAGLTIRDEELKARPFHGLKALKERAGLTLPYPEQEETAIFRDDATGAITTRLTAMPGDDNFGEGGIWSADGAAIKFESPRKINGIPVCLPGEGRIIAGPSKAIWNIWSPVDPDILYAMKKEGMKYTVSSWSKSNGAEEKIVDFTVPETGSYIEFKNFTPSGKLIVGFRETPHLYIVDFKNKSFKYIKLPVRLKDATMSNDDKTIVYANCYTFEIRTYNVETMEEGLAPSYSAGHASWGTHGMVANFGGHLNVLVPETIDSPWEPGNQITVWANWKNDIVTDYGSFTSDNKYVFTNGRKADVDSQHLMIPSEDPGAILRVAKYFTKFSWTSTTYSRPSPDYTKLIYNENMLGNTELHMVYTRRPNIPENVSLAGDKLSWTISKPEDEIKGFNIYASDKSGRDFVRINDVPVRDMEFTVGHFKYYTVAALENSGLESSFSLEVSAEGTRSAYFEAEEMKLIPPARRFFDGYCSNFQCVRINAESDEEIAREGSVSIPLNGLPEGEFIIWGKVKGNGKWKAGETVTEVSADEWQWVKLGSVKNTLNNGVLYLSSDDDDLKLDLVLLTKDDFVPSAPYPADGTAPAQVVQLKAVRKGNNVSLSWNAPADKDVHHFSVYCGKTLDFVCNNNTIIRSVLKTSITDVLPAGYNNLYYKVLAVDNRWNESTPAVVLVK